MKPRRFLGGLTMTILVLFGAFSPVIDIVAHGTPQVAYAEDKVATGSDCATGDIVCGLVKMTTYVLGAGPIALATISGIMLDYSIWTTISSDSYTSQDGVDSFVVRGWKMVRDFSNLVFIFGLFLAAFVLILGKEQGGDSLYNPKRLISRILLMAIFINFSFFLCRTIIDVGNIVARTFYSQITTNNEQAVSNLNKSTTAGNGSVKPVGLGNASSVYNNLIGIRSVSLGILQIANPQALLVGPEGETNWEMGNYTKIIVVYLLVALFNLFLTYVFFSSAAFLFVRTIGLWFLIILSPVAFASRVIPSLETKEYFGWDDWLTQLVGLASSVAIFLFFTYLAVMFLKVGLTELKPGEDGGIIGTVFTIGVKLILVGIVLILGKKVSKDLSGKIGVMASNGLTSAITGVAMAGATFATGGIGAVGALGRRYAGNKVASGISRVTGENVEAVQQRMRSGLKNFSFNPRKMDFRKMAVGAATLASLGSKTPGNINTAINQGSRFGSRFGNQTKNTEIIDRAKKIQAIRDTKTAKLAAIDKKLEEAKKKFNDSETSPAEKLQLKNSIASMVAERKGITNPQPTKTPSQAPASTPVPAVVATTTATAQQPVAKVSTILDAQGKPIMNNGQPEASAPRPIAANRSTGALPQNNIGTATSEEKNNAITAIERELKAIDEQAKKPETIGNKAKTEELQRKYSELEQERRDATNGAITPIRLKSISSTSIGAPVTAPERGDGSAPRPEYTLDLNRAVTPINKVPQVTSSTNSVVSPSVNEHVSKTSSLLSGITTGAPVTAPERGDGSAPRPEYTLDLNRAVTPINKVPQVTSSTNSVVSTPKDAPSTTPTIIQEPIVSLNTVPKPPIVSTPQATATLNKVTSQQDTLIAKNLEQEKAPSYVPPVIIGSQEPVQPVNLVDGSGKPLLKDDSSILDIPKPPQKIT